MLEAQALVLCSGVCFGAEQSLEPLSISALSHRAFKQSPEPRALSLGEEPEVYVLACV